MTTRLETWGFDLRTAEGYQAWRETQEALEEAIDDEAA